MPLLEVAGLSVHHHIPTTGPTAVPVVLVHGAMDRGAGWARASRRLRHLELVRYDRRGYGRSTTARDGPAGFAGHRQDLAAVLATCAADRPAVVVGHSYGGLLALTAAFDGWPGVAAAAAYEAPLPWAPWWPRVDDDHRADPEGLAERFLRGAIGDDAWDSLPAATRRARRAEGRALLDDLDGLDVCPPELAAAGERMSTGPAVPVVLAVGGATRGRHRRAFESSCERWRPRATMEIPGAGHGALLSHPDAVGRLVELTHRLGGGATDPVDAAADHVPGSAP